VAQQDVVVAVDSVTPPQSAIRVVSRSLRTTTHVIPGGGGGALAPSHIARDVGDMVDNIREDDGFDVARGSPHELEE
jgi:hypothetical protein